MDQVAHMGQAQLVHLEHVDDVAPPQGTLLVVVEGGDALHHEPVAVVHAGVVDHRIACLLYTSDPQAKMHLLLEYTGAPRNIADPWYTGNFDETWDDVWAGCTALLTRLEGENAR